MNVGISSNPLISGARRLVGLLLLIGCLQPALSLADEQVPEVELQAELRVLDVGSVKNYHFIPAAKVKQGDEIFYTVRIRNDAATALDGVEVVQPIPANTHYVTGSAAGAGALIDFSVDGGKSFARAEDLKLLAMPDQYTHIRWHLRYALAPNAVVLARFRAVFQ